ncbi:MAG TPA: hypothetical protein VMF35_16695 [Acidimicrobiales bacterium]|nr:hypothetical protein [Acidimicrobiales bacterium]
MTQRGRNISSMAGRVEERTTTTGATSTAPAPARARKPLPDTMPWHVVGWVFRDGECVAIERQGDQPAPDAGGD